MKTKESLHLERISFEEEILSGGKKMEGLQYRYPPFI
jgi:hypothetical protein